MTLSKIVPIGTVAYHEYSLETALKGIQRAGCEYVEAFAGSEAAHVPPDMDDTTVEALLAKLQQYGLKIVSLNGNIGMMRKDDVEQSKKLISLAPKFGAAIVVNTIQEAHQPGSKVRCCHCGEYSWWTQPGRGFASVSGKRR